MAPSLIDALPSPWDPDAAYTAFAEWAESRGLPLYPAQEEAISRSSRARTSSSRRRPARASRSSRSARTSPRSRRAGARYYTAPIKALVSEKFFALVDIFGAENVGMVTGDSSVNAGRADHLLHRRDPREPRAAPRRRKPTSTRS